MTYTHGYAASVTSSHATRGAADSAAYLLPHLRAGMRVVDVGCGPGSITLDLAAAVGPTGQVIGVDIAEAVLDLARAAAERRGDRHTRWVRADVADLPLAPRSADVVHAHQVLQHLSDPVGAVRAMARLVKPGGLLALREVDFGATTWWPDSPGLADWLAAYRSMARGNATTPDAGRRLPRWVHEAGLTELTTSGSVWTYADPGQRAWLARSWIERIHESLLPQAGRHGVDPQTLARAEQGWSRWSAEPDGYLAFVHTEVLARVP